MRGPLPPVALLYVSGLLLAAWIHLPLSWLFGVAFGLAILTAIARRRREVLLAALLVLAGSLNLTVRTAVLSPFDLRTLVGDRFEYVSLRATLLETPMQRVSERNGRTQLRSVVQIESQAVRRGTDWQPAYGKVMLTTRGLLDERFFKGQAIEVTGVLGPPKGPIADGLFDYRAYLKTLNIHLQLVADSTNDCHLANPPDRMKSPPLSDNFIRWAKRILAKGLPDEDEAVRLLWAMTLGWKTALTDEVSEPFMRSGTLHVFAISGLHIALIALILVSLLRVLQLSRPVCGMIALPLLWFYTAATGWQASAIRSAVMMTVIIGGWALNRPTDLVNSLAAAALIILVWDPLQLFQASFQLSFFVVLSIALLLPPLEKWRCQLLKADPLVPAELRPRWQRWLESPLRHLSTSLATSLAAWLGSLPLIAYYFYLVTPVSLLANLIIVPVSGLALMSSFGSLCCGDWLPQLTVLFNHAAWFWMHLMVRFSVWSAALPGAFYYVAPPGLFAFAVYYLLLAACLSGWLFTRARLKWSAAVFSIVAVAWLLQHHSENQPLRITVLPVGGGVVFAKPPGGSDHLLIDCGDKSAAEFVLAPFLHSQGIGCLQQVLLTHGLVRQVGGFEHLKAHFPINRVFTSSVRFRSPVFNRILQDLKRKPKQWRQAHRGDQLSAWSVLHPKSSDHFSMADDNTTVLRGEFFGVRILLLSNLGRAGQGALLEREKVLRADILIGGLPGRGEPFAPELLEAVQPRLLIVSSAESRATGRASPQLRERLGKLGIPVFFTGDIGTITLTIRPKHWELSSVRGHHRIFPSQDPRSAWNRSQSVPAPPEMIE